MKAIILAAGEGSRLGELCVDKPKCLIDIEDNTLLEIQINTLHSCGIDDITIVRGHKGDKINIPGLTYYENSEYSSTNMLHSLFCASKEMTGEILVLYSDIIYEEDVVKRIISSNHDITVGVNVNWQEALLQRKIVSPGELEMVYFDSENRVQQIGKDLTDEFETRGQFIGMVLCSKRGTEILIRNYDRTRKIFSGKPFKQAEIYENAYLTDLFQEMADIGIPLHCAIIERGWLEIDTPDDYERAIEDTRFVRRLVKVKTDWNHRAKTYDDLNWTSRDELLDNIVEMAAPQPGFKVLDLGTGTGKILIALEEKCSDAEYYGIDISSGMLDRIDSKYGFNLSISEMENLDNFSNDSFDLVTARMVFHHANDLNQSMREVYRVLKPEGRFIICEGNPPDLNSLAFYNEMFRFKEDRHTFTLDDLVNLFVPRDFFNICSRTIMLSNMSLNNWLDNSGLPFRNIDIIKKMHLECSDSVKNAYNMKFVNQDIYMDWKFSIVSGTK